MFISDHMIVVIIVKWPHNPLKCGHIIRFEVLRYMHYIIMNIKFTKINGLHTLLKLNSSLTSNLNFQFILYISDLIYVLLNFYFNFLKSKSIMTVKMKCNFLNIHTKVNNYSNTRISI